MNRSVSTLSAALVAATLALAAPALAAQTPNRAPLTPTIVAEREARVSAADRGRIRGNTDAPVWVVVISDYQCPFCKKWHDETEPRINAEYVRTGKVQIAYINYPIPSIHPNAPATHEAAMCAAEQGKFWPVSDALFATQSTWKSQKNVARFADSLAVAAGVDAARFRSCIADGIMKPLIEADVDRSTRIGVGSTPSFLVGGRPLVGAQPFEAFKQAIDAALAAAAKPKPKP
jgi:protein-disulfide isomerase